MPVGILLVSIVKSERPTRTYKKKKKTKKKQKK